MSEILYCRYEGDENPLYVPGAFDSEAGPLVRVVRCEHGKIDPHEWRGLFVRQCPGSPTLNNKGEDE